MRLRGCWQGQLGEFRASTQALKTKWVSALCMTCLPLDRQSSNTDPPKPRSRKSSIAATPTCFWKD